MYARRSISLNTVLCGTAYTTSAWVEWTPSSNISCFLFPKEGTYPGACRVPYAIMFQPVQESGVRHFIKCLGKIKRGDVHRITFGGTGHYFLNCDD